MLKSLNSGAKTPANLPLPITVRLNKHNTNDAYRAHLEWYRDHNMDSDNLYRILEKVKNYGFIHDATTHWVKEINTVFIRAVDDKGNIAKVPFSMKCVPGSLTGEVLCKEIIEEISSVKVLKSNAALASCTVVHDAKIQSLHSQLKEAANNMELDRITEIQEQIKALQNQEEYQQVSMSDAIIPKPPHYFKIARLEGADHAKNTIHLVIAPEFVPTSICGDGCSTNLKACRLVTNAVASCSSHASSGTIRRTTTSVTMSDPDAVNLYNNLYNNLKTILKHF